MVEITDFIRSQKEFWIPDAERSSEFRQDVISLNKRSMSIIGVLGIISPVIFILIQIISGKALAWQYSGQIAGEILVIWDKLLVIALGVVCLILAHTETGPRWGRLIVAVILVIAGAAVVLDDIAGARGAFSAGYMALVMLISVAIPFRPWQIFCLCLTLIVVYILCMMYFPPLVGWQAGDVSIREFVFLILMTIVCTGICALLYNGHFRQHQAMDQVKMLNELALISEQKYRSLFDNSADAIFMIDNASGRFVLVNPMMEKILGITAAELYKMHFQEIIYPDDREMVVDYHRSRLKGEPAPTQYSFRVTSRLWTEPRVCDLKIYDFEPDARVTVGAVRDITERVLAEQQIRDYAFQCETMNRELQETQVKLVQSEKMASLGSLVAGVAHEINTPIGAVGSMHNTLVRAVNKMRNNIEICARSCDEVPAAALHEHLAVIDEANKVIASGVERVTMIVRRLRSFARLDEADLKTVDIHEGLEDTLTLIHHEIKHGITIHKNYGDIPPVACYPGQLNQVFLNILVNAVQAMKGAGEITITSRRIDRRVQIEFTDNGPGIPKELLPRVFDPGFTTKGVGVGTGLGLSICYQIIKDHKGEIEVSSTVGKGTTFTVTLPTNLDELLGQSREKE